MSAFEGTPTYSVGIAAMDNQHKRLFEMVHRLYEAMRAGKGDQVIHGILKELANYTLTHFAAEEELMRKAGYPGLNAHIDLHKVLVDKVIQMTEGVKTGKKIAAVSLATFLKDWLIGHIQKEDRRYGLHLQNQTAGQK